MKTYTLYELNQLVGETLQAGLQGEYWVTAELSELREVRGHCYMELAQRPSSAPGSQLLARASAKCWKGVWSRVRPRFELVAGQPLRAGMQVMLCVYAQFHEAYGFSWIVTDVNPEYTLGDMARRRQEIIRQLKAEGVFDLQRELQLPLFAQRIAVVSSAGAAGYGDFCRQLSESGYHFHVQLFPATMQGEATEQSVIAALNAIYAEADRFDCVAIIRGGGATSDLGGFDTLALAENVANFPLPVLTGIGHDRDESILDLVACVRLKTPTAVAAFLVDRLAAFDAHIADLRGRLSLLVGMRLQRERERLGRLSAQIPALFSVVRTRQESHLDRLQGDIAHLMRQRIEGGRHRLQLLAERTRSLDPQRLLARGYSITYHEGRVVRDARQLPPGTRIRTLLAKGSVESVVDEG